MEHLGFGPLHVRGNRDIPRDHLETGIPGHRFQVSLLAVRIWKRLFGPRVVFVLTAAVYNPGGLKGNHLDPDFTSDE